ncbi:dipeptide/oligopeptide/nickel ABC transporter permease/ATP-binding protein [Kitasatospora sp. NPDC002965]|uniref:dipeptide/oligopeptide/nickel ABC transporter permease/ATP-binding protein n=1 Tax=Kitasatospora sp. NPDC002965 TaxID=3154775 RepID=UPI0033B661A5
MNALRTTLRVPLARVALAALGVVLLLALFGDRLAPMDPLAQDPSAILHNPGGGHLLGTDYLGRDVLSRLLAGTGLSVLAAAEAVAVAALLGVVPGLLSVRFGSTGSWLALRSVDALMTLPFTLFAIAAVGLLGNGLHQAMIALGVLLSPLFFRVVRAAALGLDRAQYVEAAELMGASRAWILRVHTWRKVLPTVAVTTAHALATSLLTVSSLTFLGIGVQPPAPTWGGMLASDLGFLAQQPWAPAVPTFLIMVTIGALNLLADVLADADRTDTAALGAPAGEPAGKTSGKKGALPTTTAGARTAGTEPSGGPHPPADDAALRVEGLHVTVGGGRTEAVRDVSFTVRPGEALGLVGESGSGKTLTCRSVLGLLAPGVAVSAGRITLGAAAPDAASGSPGAAEPAGPTGPAELTGLTDRAWQQVRGDRLGAVFQDPGSYLNPSLTVGRQLGEPLRLRLGLSRDEARRRAVELFEAVGLRDPQTVHDSYPHELSGGMLQRVLIAVAVSGDPGLLVADEATTALDTVVQAEVLDLLDGLRKRRGLALLLVSHDLAVVADVCDRILVFYAGEIVEEGPTAEVIARPAHPYTEALLQVASLGRRHRREPAVIPGRPPEPGTAGPGCRFADRCAYATPDCTGSGISLTPVGGSGGDGTRRVRCVRAEDLALTGAWGAGTPEAPGTTVTTPTAPHHRTEAPV